MKLTKKMIHRLQVLLENQGKARALASLREIDPRLLEEYGFSIEALDQGIGAWPWRKPEPAAVEKLDVELPAANEAEHKQAA